MEFKEYTEIIMDNTDENSDEWMQFLMPTDSYIEYDDGDLYG